MTVGGNNLFAYCFGGVFDIEDEEENISGNFFNDLYQLDLEKFVWKTVTVSGKKDKEQKARRRKKDTSTVVSIDYIIFVICSVQSSVVFNVNLIFRRGRR